MRLSRCRCLGGCGHPRGAQRTDPPTDHPAPHTPHVDLRVAEQRRERVRAHSGRHDDDER
eukprot:gene11969-23930_t